MLNGIRPLFRRFFCVLKGLLGSHIRDSGLKIGASGKLHKFSRKLAELAEIYLKQKLLYGSNIGRDR